MGASFLGRLAAGIFIKGVLLCAALALVLVPAHAEHTSFLDNAEPPEFAADYLVTEGDPPPAVIKVTLAGDCTLGGTESANRQSNGLTMTVSKKGLAYPFAGLKSLFSEDDLTYVNLEGVLSDSSRGENVDKEFAFRGPASFASILPLGSVEAANLSNNHFDDYGTAGREATISALAAHGVAYAGGEWLCVFQTDGGRIGLAGIRGSLTEGKKETVRRQIALLREAGCQVILYAMHAGQEYAARHNGYQRDMARFLIDAGADVVAGHHPHVSQGVEIYNGGLIFYSLGNCVFGGNHSPRETTALAARVTFYLEDGCLTRMESTLYPIRFTGKASGNTFSPVLLDGTQAEAALNAVRQDTDFSIPAYATGEGAPLPVVQVQ